MPRLNGISFESVPSNTRWPGRRDPRHAKVVEMDCLVRIRLEPPLGIGSLHGDEREVLTVGPNGPAVRG